LRLYAPSPAARETDSIYDRPAGLSFAALREIPQLERFVLEVLRLHPPLVTLMRRVKSDFRVADQLLPAGGTSAVLRVHPLRRRTAQVRGKRLRAAPGEVDLLRPPRPLRLRASRPAGDVPR